MPVEAMNPPSYWYPKTVLSTWSWATAPAGAVAHDHVDNTVFGYQYDGGFMASTGIPSRKIGTPTTTPGDYALGLGQLPYIWIQPPDPSFDPLTFNFNSDLNKLNTDSALVTY